MALASIVPVLSPFVDTISIFSEENIPGRNFSDPNQKKGTSLIWVMQSSIVIFAIYSWYSFLRDWFYASFLEEGSDEAKAFERAWHVQMLFSLWSTCISIIVLIFLEYIH